MSLDTSANLQVEIARWLRRTDLTTEILTFITAAESQMNRRLRCQSMLSRGTLSITSALTPAPADFVAPRSLRLTSTSPTARLNWVSDEKMDDLLDTWDSVGGPPRHYTLEGSNFRLSPDPGAGPYTGNLSYYARLPSLASNTSNWLLASHPDAYLYGALAQSAPFLRADDRLPMWVQIFGEILNDINASDTGMGGALEVMPNTFGAGSI